ncbi:MAG: rubrerythrin [Candidatus Paceibacteria bacterium]|jgi:rubrerythrin
MKLLDYFAMPRYRAMWSDPVRRVRTLESFGMTEDDGGRDLLAAAKRVSDPELLHHIERHAKEEMMHGELFRRRAAELRAESQANGSIREDYSDKSSDMLRARDVEVDGHGFYDGSMLDSMGEVAYVAMVHVVEKRAANTFELHMKCIGDDEKTRLLFERVAKDEKYHISYTGKILDKWRKEGRDREVQDAIKEAERSTFLGSWKRLGLRSGAGFGKVLLYVCYWTMIAPVGLLVRGRKGPAGLQDPSGDDAARRNVASQY